MYVVFVENCIDFCPVFEGGVGGRPVDGRRGVSLATGAAASRGLRNMEESDASQEMNTVALFRMR